MKDMSYWLDIPYASQGSFAGNAEFDVVVIGGGITGVSAAYHAVRAGLKTVLIEKETIASASAGRNGGMVVEGLAVDFHEAVEQLGFDEAVIAWQRTIDSREYVAQLIAKHSIDCGFSRPGSLYISNETEGVALLAREIKERTEAGFGGELLIQDSPVGTSLYNPNDCVLQPAQFVRGLAAVAEQLGLTIYEHTLALSYTATTVTTEQGTITANTVIIAIESSTQDLDPTEGIVKREIGMVTKPFSAELLQAMNWKTGGMLWNIGEPYYISVRRIGDRMFLNGGGLPLDPTDEDLDRAQDRVIDTFIQYFPSIKKDQVVISHRWTGLLLYPHSLRTHIQHDNGYYEAYGNGGTGLTNGIMAGKMVIDSVLKG